VYVISTEVFKEYELFKKRENIYVPKSSSDSKRQINVKLMTPMMMICATEMLPTNYAQHLLS
jgi:hypothetical protein